MKRNFICNKFLYFIIIAFGISCSNLNDEMDSYFSLKTNLKNEYSVILSTPYKNVVGNMLEKFEKLETINGKEYHKIVSIYSGIPEFETQTYFYRKSKDGVFAIKKVNESLSEEYLDVKFPIHIGSNWKSITPDGEIECSVISIEDLDLINKKYKDCLKLVFESNFGSNGYMYYSKGEGLVKSFVSIRRNYSIEFTLKD